MCSDRCSDRSNESLAGLCKGDRVISPSDPAGEKSQVHGQGFFWWFGMSENRRSFGGSHVFPQNILNLTRSTQILLLQTRGTYVSALYSVGDSSPLQTSQDERFRRSQTSVKAMSRRKGKRNTRWTIQRTVLFFFSLCLPCLR